MTEQWNIGGCGTDSYQVWWKLEVHKKLSHHRDAIFLQVCDVKMQVYSKNIICKNITSKNIYKQLHKCVIHSKLYGKLHGKLNMTILGNDKIKFDFCEALPPK